MEKLLGKKNGKYYQKTNIIAGYVNHTSIAPMVFNGSCNTQLIEAWAEHFNQRARSCSSSDHG
ncbi:hypothetical protein [Candidatus Sarmatiella mevalonica]|uniref:hypothetical protein n=1 Tax=Candidatus Sarmatiella mevalonica TaxID=2770581 RepID=UPI001924F0A2|nr:hypothetical protein [Candidatus Sarmatiella mevalonica]